MSDFLAEGKAKLTIDTSNLVSDLLTGLNDAQKTADKKPIKYKVEVDRTTIDNQLKKDQKTLFKELNDAYNQYGDFKLDDKGFAKAIQVYVASGGELNKAFKDIALSYNDLKETLKTDFIPINQIELFKDSVKELNNIQVNPDFSKIDFSKLEKLNNALKKVYENDNLSPNEFIAYVQDFERQGGIFTADLKQIKESYDNLITGLKNTKIPTLNIFDYDTPKLSIDDLFADLSKFASENGNKNVSQYWDNLAEKIQNGDESLKQLLVDLGLYNTELNQLNLINDGRNNSGGLIGDEKVLIARKQRTQEQYENTVALKKALDTASESGVNVAKILDVIYDKESKMMVEVQQKASGNILGSYGDSAANDKIYLDMLEATDEQIQKLISDLLELQKLGLGTDLNLSNILFDKEKGFQLIDIDWMTQGFNANEFVDDLLGGTVNTAIDHFEAIGDAKTQGLFEKLQERFISIGADLSKAVTDGYAEGQDSHSPSKVFEQLENDAVDGIVQGEEKNKDRLAEVGRDMAKAVKAGFDEEISNVGDNTTSSIQSPNISNTSTIDKIGEQAQESRQEVEKLDDAINELNNSNDAQSTSYIDKLEQELKDTEIQAEKTEQVIKEATSLPSVQQDTPLPSDNSDIEHQNELQNELAKTGQKIEEVTTAMTSMQKASNQDVTYDTSGLEHVQGEIVDIAEANKELGKTARASIEDVNGEGDSASSVADKMIELAKAKKEAVEANLKLKESAENSVKALTDEGIAAEKANEKVKNKQGQKDLNKAEKNYGDLVDLAPYVVNADQYKERLAEIDNLLEKLRGDNVDLGTDEAKKDLKEVARLIENLKKDQNFKLGNPTKAASEYAKLAEYLAKNTKLSAETKAKFKALQEQFKNFNGSREELANLVNEVLRLKAAASEAGETGKSFATGFREQLKHLWQQGFAQFFGLYDIIRYIKQGIDTVRELDTAMVEVRKVSDETESTYARFSKTVSESAKEIASTNKELLNSSADFLRLGYSIDQASELAKNTAVFVNVGDGIQIDEATEDMITAMKAFDIKAEESMKIVDSYNQIGKIKLPKHIVIYGEFIFFRFLASSYIGQSLMAREET